MKIAKVTASESEARLLHAALADFSAEGAREIYASWLETQGDRERASALRATVQAYHTLDASSLEGLHVDQEWQRMIAVPLLKTLSAARREHSIESLCGLRDLAFPRIRAALSMTLEPADADTLGQSRMWGLPDIPEGETWPKVGEVSDWFGAKSELPQDLHCAFLAQVNFDEMRGTVLGGELPLSCGFAVFSITEVEKLGIRETLIRPWSTSRPLRRTDAPEDLLRDPLGDSTNKPQAAHSIVLTEDLSLPDASWGPFAEAIPGCGFGEEFHAVYRQLSSACQKDSGYDGAGRSWSNKYGFGGYLKATSGADPSPDMHAVRFAVLPADPDAGTVHFAISEADLRDGVVTRAQYVWSDWDG
ncbi:MAG: hypothetical protein ABL889_03675 [Terricaulis sp.]